MPFSLFGFITLEFGRFLKRQFKFLRFIYRCFIGEQTVVGLLHCSSPDVALMPCLRALCQWWLIRQWQMPTRRDYTFPQAPGTEPAMCLFLVILCPCWLIRPQQFPIYPTFLIPASSFCFPACCGSCFSSLESFLYYSVFSKQDICKWDKYFVSWFLHLSLVICLTVPFLSQALRQLKEDKPIYFGGSRWPPSGCLDFSGFSLVLILALIEFRVYFGLCVRQCFSVLVPMAN